MKRKKHNSGFTMAEVLIVIAIMSVLAGVTFINVIKHMRNMTKLEYDGYAKEIFVAAQNHLTMAAHEGYHGIPKNRYGILDESGTPRYKEGNYYIVVKNGVVDSDNSDVISLMLPDGALADGKALSGSYIIRYHKGSARVLDVFYWEESAGGSAGRYPYSYIEGSYTTLIKLTKTPAELATLSNYDGSVIGYYGGATAGLTYRDDVKAPTIIVDNGDVLSVTVNNPNGSDVAVVLQINGKISEATKKIDFNNNPVILDDITNVQGNNHFAALFPDFIPGEDIEISAIAYKTVVDGDVISNVAFSDTKTTNSLFDSIKDGNGDSISDTACIRNIRHLENIDDTISNVATNHSELAIVNGEQLVELNYSKFKPHGSAAFCVVKYNYNINDNPGIKSGSFLPMSPQYTLTYNGMGLSITNVTVSEYSSDAGLFGKPTEDITVKNLQLTDFSIAGTNAGALGGDLSGATVINVVAYNTREQDGGFNNKVTGGKPNITGTASAGGLIGKQRGGSVTASAAALYVSGETAGGFIGTLEKSASVTDCYSGGHTEGGMYKSDNYNVRGSNYAGGFIGSMTSGKVEACYSTCSAFSANKSGGFVGDATKEAGIDTSSIVKCYCTGFVSSDVPDNKGAFAGSITAVTTDGCQYFSIISGLDVNAIGNTIYPSTTITPFDGSTADYRSFISGTKDNATPYDNTLIAYYKGKYTMKSVANISGNVVPDSIKSAGYSDWNSLFISQHYGDWPSPEIFFINVRTS